MGRKERLCAESLSESIAPDQNESLLDEQLDDTISISSYGTDEENFSESEQNILEPCSNMGTIDLQPLSGDSDKSPSSDSSSDEEVVTNRDLGVPNQENNEHLQGKQASDQEHNLVGKPSSLQDIGVIDIKSCTVKLKKLGEKVQRVALKTYRRMSDAQDSENVSIGDVLKHEELNDEHVSMKNQPLPGNEVLLEDKLLTGNEVLMTGKDILIGDVPLEEKVIQKSKKKIPEVSRRSVRVFVKDSMVNYAEQSPTREVQISTKEKFTKKSMKKVPDVQTEHFNSESTYKQPENKGTSSKKCAMKKRTVTSKSKTKSKQIFITAMDLISESKTDSGELSPESKPTKKGAGRRKSLKQYRNDSHSVSDAKYDLGLYDPKGVREGVVRTEKSPEYQSSSSLGKSSEGRKGRVTEAWHTADKLLETSELKKLDVQNSRVTEVQTSKKTEVKTSHNKHKSSQPGKVRTLLDPSKPVVAQVKRIASLLPAVEIAEDLSLEFPGLMAAPELESLVTTFIRFHQVPGLAGLDYSLKQFLDLLLAELITAGMTDLQQLEETVVTVHQASTEANIDEWISGLSRVNETFESIVLADQMKAYFDLDVAIQVLILNSLPAIEEVESFLKKKV